jgi:hypothetical protein
VPDIVRCILSPTLFSTTNDIANAMDGLVDAITKPLSLSGEAIQIVSLLNFEQKRKTQLSAVAAFSLDIEGFCKESKWTLVCPTTIGLDLQEYKLKTVRSDMKISVLINGAQRLSIGDVAIEFRKIYML